MGYFDDDGDCPNCGKGTTVYCDVCQMYTTVCDCNEYGTCQCS
jgi:hypothetical protein